MNASTLRLSLIAIAVLGAAACSHHEAAPEHAPGATAAAPQLSNAVDEISDARCDREQRCNNVGAGQTYADRSTCESKMHGATANDLNTKDCPNGVDRTRLSDCLKQIQSEECGNPIASVSRWSACRTSNLCIGE
jgi:hypothetical protein